MSLLQRELSLPNFSLPHLQMTIYNRVFINILHILESDLEVIEDSKDLLG